MIAESVQNPYLKELDVDYLHHLGLNNTMPLKGMFGDVRYVCMSGSADRVKNFAEQLVKEFGFELPFGGLQPIGTKERYSLYKVGPILIVSHGIGAPSASLPLNEITKLLEHAKCPYYEYIRIGTSGSLGVEPGTVVVTSEAVNGELKAEDERTIFGEKVKRPTQINRALTERIFAARGDIVTVMGKTMSCDGFYEEQGRLDGALKPLYTSEEAMAFLHKAYEAGVRNIEMEALQIAAFCLAAGIPAAVICTVIVNRFNGDQITSTPEELKKFSGNAERIVMDYLNKDIEEKGVSINYKPYLTVDELPEDEQELVRSAREAMETMAQSKHYRFVVGAAVQAETGEIYVGANGERSNGDGICAERIALAKLEGDKKKFKKIVTIGKPAGIESSIPTAPCGRCRQALRDFAKPGEEHRFIMVSSTGNVLVKNDIEELLPISFGDTNLEE
ncbi:uridine phosphorylase [Candidatus Peregrinibacteria bacterium RIFOXYB2_FULL_33_20]|nr:MAG: uridine phosphorylase [Candidatus Peregrinibacteria bacterium RIFOXYB2_FULL_33_20]